MITLLDNILKLPVFHFSPKWHHWSINASWFRSGSALELHLPLMYCMCLHRGWLFTFIFPPQSCDLRNALLIHFFVPLSLPGNSVRFLQKRPCNTTTGTKELHPKSLAGACRLLSLTVSWGQWGVMLPASLSSLLPGTLMILKSACSNNSSYIDRLISVFMLSLQKMVREHLSPQPNAGAAETSTGDHSLDTWVKEVLFFPKDTLTIKFRNSSSLS